MAFGVSFSPFFEVEPERRFIILSILQVHSGMLKRGEEGERIREKVCK